MEKDDKVTITRDDRDLYDIKIEFTDQELEDLKKKAKEDDLEIGEELRKIIGLNYYKTK